MIEMKQAPHIYFPNLVPVIHLYFRIGNSPAVMMTTGKGKLTCHDTRKRLGEFVGLKGWCVPMCGTDIYKAGGSRHRCGIMG